ncbi:hypothetical protein CRUP_014692 [Coryphaenoides rupestris]|nr:hypothetical protein CRUP_014692 [Coryphaenoides rupestris]
MDMLRHSSDKVSKLEGTVEYYKKKLEDANRCRNELETENRLINQHVIEGQGQVEELQKDLQEQGLKADDSAMLKKKNQEYMDKLRELNDELLKKSTYIDDMEPKYNANTQCVDELEEALKRKEDHESMQDMLKQWGELTQHKEKVIRKRERLTREELEREDEGTPGEERDAPQSREEADLLGTLKYRQRRHLQAAQQIIHGSAGGPEVSLKPAGVQSPGSGSAGLTPVGLAEDRSRQAGDSDDNDDDNP